MMNTTVIGDIVVLTFDESLEVRKWITILELTKKFNACVDKSHKFGEVACILAGGHCVKGDDFDMDINFVFRFELTAGTILNDGSAKCIVFLSYGEQWRKICKRLVERMTMIMVLKEETDGLRLDTGETEEE